MKLIYKSLGQWNSKGGGCGYNVVAGVCIEDHIPPATEPFVAYYGGNEIRYSTREPKNPVFYLPNHVGCDAAKKDFAGEVQKICGPGRKALYGQVDSWPEGPCGYAVVAGVCITE